MQEYQETKNEAHVSPLDRGIEEEGPDNVVCNKPTPTGKCLWILNLSAQASLTNGL